MSAWGLLIYNAASGSAADHPPEKLLGALRSRGAEVRLHEFSEGDDPAVIVKQALQGGASWIAVAGGDGTIEAAAAALIGTDVPLGIIPCGTYNNFALNASIPFEPMDACAIIAGGAARAVDVGLVNGKPFFECVGVGLDAELFSLGEEIKSGAVSRTWEFLHRAMRYPLHRFEITLDRPFREAQVECPKFRSWRRALRGFPGRTLRLKAWMITISNGPYYGMNFTIAPHARIDDGHLTVAIFKRYSKLRLWWHFFSIRAGRRVHSPRLISLRACTVRIDHKRRLPAHADGNAILDWPIDVSMLRASLRVFFRPEALEGDNLERGAPRK